MKTFSNLLALLGAVSVLFSCGTTKTVHYVYVDNPSYSPATRSSSSTSSSNYSSSRETNSENRKITVVNSSQRNTAPSISQDPVERVRMASEQTPKGAYRGFGSYTSTDLDLAIDMAQANAIASMGNRAITQIQRQLEGCTKGSNSQATLSAVRKIKQKLTDYVISDWRIVDSYVSKGPTYQACYCVEAYAADIIADLNPIIQEMDPSDREKVKTVLSQGGK